MRTRCLAVLLGGCGCAAFALFWAGCSAGSSDSGGYGAGQAGTGGTIPLDGQVLDTQTGDTTSLIDGLNYDSSGTLTAEVFGHSASTLYKLDPDTKAVTVVGDFSGCDQVIDIALDKDSNLWGTTFDGLYTIDKDTAKCKLVKSGSSYPNSLSFVPEGVLDDNAETLVGYSGSDYVKIDRVTGDMETVGGLGSGYSSSGDIVSVIGGATYLTVKGNGCGDCLIEVDPKTGDMVKNWGKVGYESVFGLAFWGGSVYGFSDGGKLFEVQFSGSAFNTVEIATGGPSDLSFWGAGSTTAAPLHPVY